MREMKNSGVEWIGEIPATWTVSKLKNYIKCYDGRRVPIDSAKRVSGPYPYWGAGSITDYVDDYLFDEELILLGEDGAPFFDDTRPVAFLINEKIWANNHIHVIKPLPLINASFLVNYLNIVDYGTYINGSILSKLTQSNMNNISLVVPSLEEQHRIADFLDEKCAKIDVVIEKQKQVIEKLKEYKLSVITEAVTKGIDPTVPMKDSGVKWIGEMPEGWKVRKLRYLGSCINGISKGGEYFGRGYPFVSYGDVYKNIQLPKQVNGLVDTTEKEREWYSVKEGDVFFTRTSETIEEVALTSTCMQTIENATFAGFLIRFRPDTDLLVKEFSKYYFRSTKHRAFFVKEMNLVTRASLSQELLKRLPVLLPPVSEQMEISKYLEQKCSEIDSAISKKQAIVEKLTEYKKSLIYEVVTGKREV